MERVRTGGYDGQRRLSAIKYSVFTRILIACLVPLIVIFSLVVAATNKIVSDQTLKFADDKSRVFAAETTQRINDGLLNKKGALELLNMNLTALDPANPNAVVMAENFAQSTLNAMPDIYCVWFSFLPDGFTPGERFSRDYARKNGQIIELADLTDEILGDEKSTPWYNVPLKTGKTYFFIADYYDYGLGEGEEYTDTVSAPIIRDGKTVGVVGIDTLYAVTFKFIDEKQIEGEQKVLLLSEKGDIVYSTDNEQIKKSILDGSFQNKDKLIQSLNKNETFWIEDVSPFFKKQSRMYFTPVYTELTDEQLYLYVDLPVDKLYAAAKTANRTIAAVNVLGLILLVLSLFFTIRSIVKPIKRLTENANLIADGNLDVNLDLELKNIDETKQTKNEINMLFAALKKMLHQLNQVQELKLETIEAQFEKEKAHASVRAKSDFLAKMSHEIRTPMNAIIGMAELTLRKDIPPDAYEQVATIKQAGSNLLAIINDILDFSKIESGKIEIIPVNYLFPSLINDVINIIRMRVMDSKIQFVVNIDSNIPNALLGDEIRIRQILLNLLSNAVKYTEEGFVSISAISEITAEDTAVLTIEVADSGKGIKEEDLDKLFGDFVQIDLVKNKGIEGTGLGLAIARNFARAMDGDIAVRSEYGKGSVFTLTLPQKFSKYEKLASVENPQDKSVLIYERRKICADSIIYTIDNLGVASSLVLTDDELYEKMTARKYPFVFVSSSLLPGVKKIIGELQSDAKVVQLTEFGEVAAEQNLSVLAMPVHAISIANILNGVSDSFIYGEPKEKDMRFIAPEAKILIVDDINTNLKVAEGLLQPYKVQIDLCKSGKEAIGKVKTHRYDLVFMDHMMPDMDGVEATLRIRALDDEEPYFKNVPIIAMTANAVSGAREMFMQNGFHDFLSKPVDTVKLNSVLEKWLPKEKQKKSAEKNKSAAAVDTDIAISGVDVRKGVALAGGAADKYLKTLAVFYKDGLEKIEEINACLETDNLSLYTIYVHALKSASANIGATDISETAKTLELAGNQEDLVFIKTHNGKFLADLTELLENINKVLAANKTEEGSADSETLKQELVKLKAALDGLDAGAIDAAADCLQKFTAAEGIGGAVENILKNTLIGEYDEAVSLIERLLEEVNGKT